MTNAVQRRTGRPTLEDAAEIDQLLLDRTLAAIQRGGFANLSIDALAVEIGVTKQTIYRRFRSKSALIDATVERELKRLEIASYGEKSGDDPLADLERLSWNFFQTTIRPEAIAFALYMEQGAQMDDGYRARQLSHHQTTILPFRTLIAAAQARGLFRDGEPDTFARLLFDLIGGSAHRLQMGLGTHVAFDELSPARFFAGRFELFVQLIERPERRSCPGPRSQLS